MATTQLFDTEEDVAKAYLTIIRPQSLRVKRLLIKGLLNELELDSDSKNENVAALAKDGKKGSITGLRGILSDTLSDDEARRLYLENKYGL